MQSQVKFHRPQNISGASQQNSAAAFCMYELYESILCFKSPATSDI